MNVSRTLHEQFDNNNW